MQTSIVDPPFFTDTQVLTEKLHEFPPEVSQLPAVFTAIEQYITENELTTVNLNNLKLICEETFINIVNHSSTDTNCYLFLAHNKQDVLLKFVDHGIAFDPLAETSDPETDDIQIGGLGLIMIKKLSRELLYARIDGFNFFSAKFPL